jgi:DNA-binding CsgD family transcriptional regulator
MEVSYQISSELVASIYESAIDSTQWPKVAKCLANYFGTHQSVLVISDNESVTPTNVITYGVDPSINGQYLEILGEDRWCAGMLELASNSLVFSDQLVELREYKKSRFYQEICKPADVAYMVGAAIRNEDHSHLLIGCQRNESSGPFLDLDAQRMRVVSGHIAQAAFINRELTGLRLREDSLRAILNKSPFGIILCDEYSSVTWNNVAAGDIFRLQDGLTVRRGRLRTNSAFIDQELDKILSGAIRTSTGHGFDFGGFVSIGRPSGRRPYQLTVSPICTTGKWGEAVFAVIYVLDPDNPPPIAAYTFKKFLGVTSAEAKVCQALVTGMTIQEIADSFDVSINTVRTQVKSIFRKCDVQTQGQLMILLSRTIIAA